MTDRFANGDPRNDDANGYKTDLADASAWHGGDLKGLAEHLDYIRGMGFDAIWITPVITQHHEHGYHGYWGYDWFTVDGHLGTMSDLQALVAQAHQLGMKVMLDTVANHTGRYDYHTPTFPDADEYHHNGVIRDYSNQWNVENQAINELNDLDQSNAKTRKTLLEQVRWLVSNSGVDGLRLDTAKHVPKEFLSEFTSAAGVFVMGEVYHGDPRYTADYTHHLSSVLDYPMYYTVKEVFGHGASMRELHDRYALDDLYVNAQTNGVFIDNHDQPRFLCDAAGSEADKQARLKLALTFLFTGRGIPILYYGTEQSFHGCTDPANREDMFHSFDRTSSLYALVTALNRARAHNAALRTGNQHELFVSDNVYAFERQQSDEAALVILNNSPEPQTVELAGIAGFAESSPLIDEVTGAASNVLVSNGSARVTVGARQGLVLGKRR